MPKVGAFARIWAGEPLDQIVSSMVEQGLTAAQWNFSALGQATISSTRNAEDHRRVRAAFEAQGVELWGLSASFNLIEPDLNERERLVRGACRMIEIAPALGVTAVTILTGSRSADGYSFDPRNREAGAWAEVLRALEPILAAASDSSILIGVEPEGGNVVMDAERGLALFEELGDDAPIGFVLDPWNLVEGDLVDGARRRPADVVIDDAFRLLGPRTICVQAKDPIGAQYPTFGLDYRQVAELHQRYAPDVPVIIQDVERQDIPRAVDLLVSAWS
jgi:sugar phosphate isomerase/epimerase